MTFDHLPQMEAAKESPQAFLRGFDGQTVLDEIQYVPELFRELKIIVDADRDAFGRWILTGSQHFEMMESVSESLAGPDQHRPPGDAEREGAEAKRAPRVGRPPVARGISRDLEA